MQYGKNTGERHESKNHQYSAAAAMGLFKSVISLIFVGTSYLILYKKSDYRVF